MTIRLPGPIRLMGSLRALAVVALAMSVLAPAGVARAQGLSGPELAAELRRQRPAEGFTNTGVLRLRDAAGRRTEIPITLSATLEGEGWRMVYSAAKEGLVERLAVVHRPDAAPAYEWLPARSDRAGTPGSGWLPFAGSDFWGCDLGLEFLHWPEQRVVKEELSNGRLCVALDSINPGTEGYARVRSWVDLEYHALLRAEAYNAQGILVKGFSTGSFRQIERPDGTSFWVLKDLRIRDARTDSRTDLIYDLPP